MKLKIAALTICMLLAGCASTAPNTNFDFKVEETTSNNFVPTHIPEFDRYEFRNSDQSVLDAEFRLYKNPKFNRAIDKKEIQHIKESEQIVEPGFPVTLSGSTKIFDNNFDNVGEAVQGTYYVIGYYDTWLHVVDKMGQCAWVLRSSVSENALDGMTARLPDITDAEYAVPELEKVEWTPDITVLKDSICYVFPSGNYTFSGDDCHITVRMNNVITIDNASVTEGTSLSLKDGTEVYADFGTEVKTDATVSTNMVTE